MGTDRLIKHRSLCDHLTLNTVYFD